MKRLIKSIILGIILFFTTAIILEDIATGSSPQGSAVAGRYIFYNRSIFDGVNSAANIDDDNAIAIDKQALLPGQTATFANYTSYSRGINGIMMDITALAGTPTVADFLFYIGNDQDPSGWTPAPSPSSITIRSGAGIAGSVRITIIWPDNTIQKEWLQITILATADTGLPENDVFYFGNAIGETGNHSIEAYVNAHDFYGVSDNARNNLWCGPISIDDLYDFNRDRNVNAIDFGIARDNMTNFLTALRLITVPDN
ncbi:MAG: hypothetical protein JW860_07060 [Sedimentisphaerales bacterium]|nr:hypothetical protein [Sedimentisphaerales bacterium]